MRKLGSESQTTTRPKLSLFESGTSGSEGLRGPGKENSKRKLRGGSVSNADKLSNLKKLQVARSNFESDRDGDSGSDSEGISSEAPSLSDRTLLYAPLVGIIMIMIRPGLDQTYTRVTVHAQPQPNGSACSSVMLPAARARSAAMASGRSAFK